MLKHIDTNLKPMKHIKLANKKSFIFLITKTNF